MTGTLRRFIWPDWQHRKQMLRKEAWFLVLAAYPLLAFAWIWPQNWRDSSTSMVLAGWTAFLVRTLQFHLGLVLLVIVAVAAIKRSRRIALVALLPALFCLFPAAVQFLPKPAASAYTGRPLRVMSVNLLMANEDTAGIIEEIIAAKPDVLLLQEYTDHWHKAVQNALAADYPHEEHIARDDSFGIAIYSRTPFAKPVDGRLMLGESGVDQQRAEIDFEGRRYAIYHIHLLPPRSLTYYMDQRVQFADLLDKLKSEPLPYVVAGDFNFSEVTPQHRELKAAGVQEAHEQATIGRGATWPVNSVFRYIPGIRIDHIYHSPSLRAIRCETGTGRGSDHRPVVVELVPSDSL